jgi:hypothetical protein
MCYEKNEKNKKQMKKREKNEKKKEEKMKKKNEKKTYTPRKGGKSQLPFALARTRGK